jgi:hypothetical protein
MTIKNFEARLTAEANRIIADFNALPRPTHRGIRAWTSGNILKATQRNYMPTELREYMKLQACRVHNPVIAEGLRYLAWYHRAVGCFHCFVGSFAAYVMSVDDEIDRDRVTSEALEAVYSGAVNGG